MLNKKAEQYKTMDTVKKKQNNTKQWTLLKNKICQTKKQNNTKQWIQLKNKFS